LGAFLQNKTKERDSIMKIIEQTRIYNPDEWGTSGIFAAFSHDGQLIAVRVPNNIWNNGEKQDNLFVYDINGNKKWFGYSLDGGTFNESGIVFYPDKYSLLVPGADDNHGSLDGLKQYQIGGHGFTLPFAHTSLNGKNTSIYAASDKGEAILGKKDGLFCVFGRNQLSIKYDGFSEAYFSPDVEYLALTYFMNWESWLYKTSESDKKIKLSGQFVCFLPNRQLLEYDKDSFVVWDINNWKVTQKVKVNLPHYIFSGASTDDGQRFALCDLNGEISLWDYKSFTLLSKINLPSSYSISRMKFSSDSQHLLTVVMDGERQRKEIIVWQVEN
jgi:WD40 repeat protein